MQRQERDFPFVIFHFSFFIAASRTFGPMEFGPLPFAAMTNEKYEK